MREAFIGLGMIGLLSGLYDVGFVFSIHGLFALIIKLLSLISHFHQTQKQYNTLLITPFIVRIIRKQHHAHSSLSFFISFNRLYSSSYSFLSASSISLYFSMASLSSAVFLMRLMVLRSLIFYFCAVISSFCRLSLSSVSMTGSFSMKLQCSIDNKKLELLQCNKQERMDQKTRILPHLNSYFLQRKAYENHRKKIQSIRNSITRSPSKIQQHPQQTQQTNNPKNNHKYSIHTIKEEIKNQLNGRITPWAKRQRAEAERENSRLQKSIKKCSSTINRKQIERHRAKNQQIKQRISKFIYNANSNKTLLKCKHSLEILRQKQLLREEERSSFNVSKKQSRIAHSRSQIAHVERYGSSERLATQMPNQKSNLQKFYLLKNRNKIKSHFDKKPQLLFQSRKLNISLTQKQKRTMTEVRNSGNKYFATQVQV